MKIRKEHKKQEKLEKGKDTKKKVRFGDE